MKIKSGAIYEFYYNFALKFQIFGVSHWRNYELVVCGLIRWI